MSTTEEMAISRNTRITIGLVLSLGGFLFWLSYNLGVYKTQNENTLAVLTTRLEDITSDIGDLKQLVNNVTADRITRTEFESWVQKLKTAAYQHAIQSGSSSNVLEVPDIGI